MLLPVAVFSNFTLGQNVIETRKCTLKRQILIMCDLVTASGYARVLTFFLLLDIFSVVPYYFKYIHTHTNRNNL